MRISLEEFRKMLGLESIKDRGRKNHPGGALAALGSNFRQRALDTAIAEINEKTDTNISLESLGRSKHRRVTALIFDVRTK
jgi:hypothetical protein